MEQHRAAPYRPSDFTGTRSSTFVSGRMPEFRRRPMLDKIVTAGDTVVFNVDVTGEI